MSTIKIGLFGEECIGRYYQLAALSTSYFRASPSLAREIEIGVTRGEIELTADTFKELFDLLVDFLESRVCTIKDKYGITIYRSGKNDEKILTQAGFTVGKTIQCSQLINYYRQGILSQRLNDTIDIPMFLRAYVFSKYRNRDEVEETKISSLYLALIGAYITLQASFVKADERFEIYVNPDQSLESLRSGYRLYTLLNEPESKIDVRYLLSNILKLSGISLEIASILSIALYSNYTATMVLKLNSLANYHNIFEKFKLVCIKPGDRPLVVWERPLTITHIVQKLERLNILDLLSSIDYSISHATKLGDKVEKYPDIISSCINNLYSYFETGVQDPLTYCTSGLVRLYDELDRRCREGDTQSCEAGKTTKWFMHRISKLGKEHY